MVVVIDYGMGNLHSVAKALEAIGAEVTVSQKPDDLHQADRIILPGVGAFAEGIRNLRASGLVDALAQEILEKGKPFLGICLGMQLLADESHEGGRHQGLGWISGSVVPLTPQEPSCRVPHVGWDNITLGPSHLPFLQNQKDFYFVHSYHFVCEDKKNILASCDYGGRFVAALCQKNILATQFHPEKSQENGLRFLKGFLGWNPERVLYS